MVSLSPIERIEAAFGCPGFPDAAFYAFEHSLRFELGGNLIAQALRFRQAIDRARTIANLAFRDSKQLSAVISYFGGERPTRRHSNAFATLRTLGFDSEIDRPERAFSADGTTWNDDGARLCRYWHSIDFANDPAKIEALLWTAVAREMGVSPNPRWLTIHIVDFDKRVALYVYDDRGADVVAMEPLVIKPLYDALGNWLLDYNRAAMDEKFLKLTI